MIMANGQQFGNSFFAGENIQSTLSGVRDITSQVAAGFARDPRERAQRRDRLAQQQDQKSEIRAERIKRLRATIGDAIKEATNAVKSNTRLGDGSTQMVKTALGQLTALTGDMTESQGLWARYNASA